MLTWFSKVTKDYACASVEPIPAKEAPSIALSLWNRLCPYTVVSNVSETDVVRAVTQLLLTLCNRQHAGKKTAVASFQLQASSRPQTQAADCTQAYASSIAMREPRVKTLLQCFSHIVNGFGFPTLQLQQSNFPVLQQMPNGSIFVEDSGLIMCKPDD